MQNPDASDFNPYILHVGGISAQTCPPAGTVFGRRQVRWFELELIHTGSGHITTDGIELATEAGSLFFRRPGMVVQGFAPYTCTIVLFDARYGREREKSYHTLDIWNNADGRDCGQGLLPGPLTDKLVLADPSLLARGFQKLEGIFLRNGADRQLALKHALFEILLAVDQSEPAARRHSSHRQRLDELCRNIASQPARQFRLADLAAGVNLSPNFLCRIFKEMYGLTLFQYIHRCKIDAAAGLLLQTELSIKAIALELGLENQSYFHTLFKRQRGMTPAEFRRRNRYSM